MMLERIFGLKTYSCYLKVIKILFFLMTLINFILMGFYYIGMDVVSERFNILHSNIHNEFKWMDNRVNKNEINYFRINNVPHQYLSEHSRNSDRLVNNNLTNMYYYFRLDGEVKLDCLSGEKRIMLRGSYSVSRSYVHIKVPVNNDECTLIFNIGDEDISNILPLIQIVKGTKNQLLGIDLGRSNLLLNTIKYGYFIAIFYFSYLGGLIFYFGISVNSILFLAYLYSRKNIK